MSTRAYNRFMGVASFVVFGGVAFVLATSLWALF